MSVSTHGGPPPQLNPIEQRILGALLEKQKTVPATYPLSLNALRSACNQTSNRDPVTDYDEGLLEAELRELKGRALVRTIWTGKSARALKFHQLLDARLGLVEEERAILTVLLLRGPQTPGEVKTRTERLHAFDSRDSVDACLQQMAERQHPLVERQERRPGHHDHQWRHLLGPAPIDSATPPPLVDRDRILADGPGARDAAVLAAYDAVALEYSDDRADEVAEKPFDAWLLGRIAGLAVGPIADVGCGPGHTTAALAAAGADVTGVDFSPAMIAEAERRFPGVRFQIGDQRRLLRPPHDAAWGAVVSWYSLVHLAESELVEAIGAFTRVLTPGGWAALAVHVGNEIVHRDEWWGHEVDLDFVHHDPDAFREAVGTAGLEVVEWFIRGPLSDIEVVTDRLYVLARKP